MRLVYCSNTVEVVLSLIGKVGYRILAFAQACRAKRSLEIHYPCFESSKKACKSPSPIIFLISPSIHYAVILIGAGLAVISDLWCERTI